MDPVEVMRPREGGDTPLEKKAKFAWKADWYIEVDLSMLTQDSEIDEFEICNALQHTRDGGLQVPNANDCKDMFEWTFEPFFEARELRHADVFEIDVDKLTDWHKGNAARRNQVLYVTFINLPATTATTDSTGDGFYPIIRLVKGKEIKSGIGFTFATDRPLYVQGDYNSFGVWPWVPAALVGDAINILSNAWDDSKSVCNSYNQAGTTLDNTCSGWSKPIASDTEVYTAILAGHSATPCDHEVAGCAGGYTDFYGGGIENYPRFLESWSGKTLAYRGSLVSLSTSQIAVGTWNGRHYSPPVRDWQFDTRFSDPSNLPPGTPVVGHVIQTAFRPGY